MKERIFKDTTGDNLIVQHRKSAVIFLRETDVSREGWVSPFWSDTTPAIQKSELNRTYNFSKDNFKELFDYLHEIAYEAWSDFSIKEEDCISADYSEYFDRTLQNDGYLCFKDSTGLILHGPHQKKTEQAVVRMYQFNRRKFESFLDVFQRTVE